MRRLLISLVVLSLLTLAAIAAPSNVFSLDDVLEIEVSGCDEAVLCRDYTFEVKVRALRLVTVRELRLYVYCRVDCCEWKVYEKTLLVNYTLDPCCVKSWIVTIRCCPSPPADPGWVRIKIYIVYNFTNTRIDNSTILFNLAPLYPISYCGLYTAYESLKQSYNDLKTEYEKLSEEYANLTQRYGELSALYGQILTQKQALEEELNEARVRIMSLSARLNYTERELSRVRKALEATQRALAEKEAALRKLKTDYSELASNFNACESKYLALVKEHESLRTKYESAESELRVTQAVLALALFALAAVVAITHVLPRLSRARNS